MITLENLVRTPLAKALGWTLFHSIWEGAVIAMVLFAALLAIRSARVRYTAACLAMLAVLAGFGFTLFLLWPERTAGAIGVAPALAPVPADGVSWMPNVSGRFRADDVLAWLTPFWMAGVLFFHLRSLTSWFAVRRLRGRGVCGAPASWQTRLVALRERVLVSRPVALLESCFADVPVVIGWLRPAILMPVGLLAGMPVNQIEAILLHELAHIRRQDYLVNLLQMVVESFLFYHPAIWWMTRVVREERENCCDDLVVAASGDARGYAAALTALEENRWAAHEAALAATGGSLVKRVRRLLSPFTPREGVRAVLSPVLSAGILAISAALALTAWQTQARAQTQGAPQVPAWQKWLDEDVVYIIQDQERTAFKNLTTDDERGQFVDQFWDRRNPVPASSDNTFKNEHYRRIAFANRHFGSRSSVPGWKTDRGRIYIIYGPPDEIDAHPSAVGSIQDALAGQGSPYEDWSYRWIEGIGSNIHMRFVDRDGTGEYHMTMDPNPQTGKLVESPAR